MKLSIILALSLLFLIAPWTSAENNIADKHAFTWQDGKPGTETELDRLSQAFVQLADHSRPAIAQIRVTVQDSKSTSTPPFGSRGSGFVIDPTGYILTAHHVIDKAKAIEVRLADSRRLAAQLVAADAQIDIAILRVQADAPLPIISMGDSDTIRVGNLAAVFGYPFGRESSMSLGIISRAGRSYRDSASFEYIQTDAGAYPGGSGGPLLNSSGQVIGIITMASERGNMGFATPINVIKRMLPRLASGEKLAWGWLGVQMSDISLDYAKALGLHPVKGVVVSSVLPGQPAARGGIKKQDVILSVNENNVETPRDVARMVGGLEAGRVVHLTILRNGKTLQLSFPLGIRPESTKSREG